MRSNEPQGTIPPEGFGRACAGTERSHRIALNGPKAMLYSPGRRMDAGFRQLA